MERKQLNFEIVPLNNGQRGYQVDAAVIQFNRALSQLELAVQLAKERT